MWFEDVDFCRRLRDRGWKIVYCPEAVFVHSGGHSKDDWRAATRYVAAQTQSGDAVLVWNAQQAFEYYRTRFPVPPSVSIFENYGWPVPLKFVTRDFASRHPTPG